MGNLRRLYRWAQKKTGLRKSTAELAAEKAFHERRALGASINAGAGAGTVDGGVSGIGVGGSGGEDGEEQKKDGHAHLLVSAVEGKTVEKPRAPSVVSASHLPRPGYSSMPKWMKHPKSKGRTTSTDSYGSAGFVPPKYLFPSASFSSSFTSFSKNRQPAQNGTCNNMKSEAPSSSSRFKGVTYETRVAMNILFGFDSNAEAKMLEASQPMDIELKELKPPRPSYRNIAISMHGYLAPLSSGYASSFRRSEHDLSDAETGSNYERLSSVSSMHENSTAALSFLSVSYWLHFFLGSSVGSLRRYLAGPADDAFYDAVRIQPFSSGAYLRGFLMSGFSSLFFHVYSLAFWKYTFSPHPELTYFQNNVKTVLLVWLCLQLVINLIQFPLRIHLHINFFESSRTHNLDSSIGILRTTIQSDVWILCRALGWLNDVIAWTGLLCVEWYLWCTDLSSRDPMRSVMVAISSTVIEIMLTQLK